MKVRKKYGFMASGAALSQAWDFNWVSNCRDLEWKLGDARRYKGKQMELISKEKDV